MIRVENLTKRFGHFTAVDHVSFAVGKGSIFGFLGPNGSDKLSIPGGWQDCRLVWAEAWR